MYGRLGDVGALLLAGATSATFSRPDDVSFTTHSRSIVDCGVLLGRIDAADRDAAAAAGRPRAVAERGTQLQFINLLFYNEDLRSSSSIETALSTLYESLLPLLSCDDNQPASLAHEESKEAAVIIFLLLFQFFSTVLTILYSGHAQQLQQQSIVICTKRSPSLPSSCSIEEKLKKLSEKRASA